MTPEDLERLKQSDMITEMLTELTKEMPRLVRRNLVVFLTFILFRLCPEPSVRVCRALSLCLV